jgi:hypothetical protein
MFERVRDAIRNWLRAIADNLALAIVTLVTIVVLTLSFGWSLWGILSGESSTSERERRERERQEKEAAERQARLATELAASHAEQEYRETAVKAAAAAKRRCDPVDVANEWIEEGRK